MIKAFRDTWELGIHSYLSYLRDRLLLARELLSESGSVFVQISDENVHHVREIMDEVFGTENFISQLSFRKTSNLAADYIPTESDFLLFYAKDRKKVKYRQLFVNKDYSNVSTDSFGCIEFSNGDWRRLNSNEKADPKLVENQGKLFGLGDLTSSHVSYAEPFNFCGRTFSPKTRYWSTTEMGLSRIAMSRRLATVGDTLRYRRHFEDFPVFFLGNNWTDTGTGTQTDSRTYVVQTGIKVIERCLLMTTDPGDLVLDPTCGSGTTAFVAEKWGRRWITTDTSRVAVTLAKQRLTTASYDYYDLKYPHEGLKGGFIYKTVPHITLKSIANNAEIDEIYERMHPAVEGALGELNRTLTPALSQGEREEGTLSPAPLPEGEGLPNNSLPAGEEPLSSPLPLGEGGPELVEGPGEGETALAPNLLKLARKLRTEQTDAEQLLWHLLRNRRFFKVKFRRQHPVAPYVLDFYCHEERLGIELDGGQHNEPDKRRVDAERTAFLKSKGIRIIRFWNNEVLQETEAVLERLYHTLTPALSQGEREEGPLSPTPLPGGEGLQNNPLPQGEGLQNNPLPQGEGGPERSEGPGEGKGLREWEVPFDFPQRLAGISPHPI